MPLFSIHHDRCIITLPLPRCPRPGRVWRWTFRVVLAVFAYVLAGVLVAAVAAWPLLTLRSTFSPARRQLLVAQASRGDLALARQAAADAAGAVGRFRNRLAWLTPWQLIPGVRAHLRYVREISDLGIDGTRFGDALLSDAAPILAPLAPSGLTLAEPQRRKILAAVQTQLPALQRRWDELGQFRRRLAAVPTAGTMGAVRRWHDALLSRAERFDAGVRQGLNFLALGLPLSGYPAPHRFLILLQNNAELRPTGGFIGTYALVTLDAGAATEFTVDDVYRLDGAARGKLSVAPPKPLRDFNQTREWFLRDSNWSPHFPDAARQAIWFFHREGGRGDIDSVVALTPEVIRDLLAAVGPLTVDGQIITAETLTDILEAQVGREFAVQGRSVAERKAFVGKVASALAAALERAPDRFRLAAALARALQENLAERQLLLFSNFPDVQRGLSLRGWAGELQPTDGDYLMLVDANLGSLKTDPWVNRTLDYRLQSLDGAGLPCRLAAPGCRVVAETKITYRNEATLNWKTTRYRTYQRLYVPAGATLLEVSGNPYNVTTGEELGKTVFATFLVVEPGSTVTVTYTYQLPLPVSEYLQRVRYELLVQKQPGTMAPAFHGDFTLNGKRFERITDLRTDRVITEVLP